MNTQTIFSKIVKIISLCVVFYSADGRASLTVAISCQSEILPNQTAPAGYFDSCINTPAKPAATIRVLDDATIYNNRGDLGVVRNSSYAYSWASYGYLDAEATTDLFFVNSAVEANGSARAEASFSDYITVLSDTLPVGTNVALNVRVGLGYMFAYGLITQPNGEGEFAQHIDARYRVGSLTGSFDNTYQFSYEEIQNANAPIEDRNSSRSDSVGNYQLSAKIGDILPVSAQLNASSSLIGGRGYVDGLSYRAYSKASAYSYEASGLSLNIDATNPQVFLLATSGHNYSIIPVPEPSSNLLLSAGLLLLLGMSKFRKFGGLNRAKNPLA